MASVQYFFFNDLFTVFLNDLALSQSLGLFVLCAFEKKKPLSLDSLM